VLERRGLTGEERGMPEPVAQHQVADFQGAGTGEDPAGDRHRLPHVVLGRQRGHEMVHEGDALEPGALRGQCPLDDRLDGHPHLREEEVKPGGGHDGMPFDV
jgi:hypothetical protein